MKVLITGATGFVGRHVMHQMRARGHDILASTLKEDESDKCLKGIQWLYGDLGNPECLKPSIHTFNAEVVIHLAWQGIPNYSEAISTINLNNSIELLDFMIEETNCRKIIVSGSCLEYGKTRGECKESDPVQINSFIAWAKHSLYQYLLLKCHKKKVSVIWFRMFYVYGPGQRSGSSIPTMVQALTDEKIPDIRTSLSRNDFVYVKDVAKAFQLAADLETPSGIYNLGSGASHRVYDVCKIVENQMLGSTAISSDVLKNGSREQSVNFWANMEKTSGALKWAPQTNLEKGIAETIESLR